MWGIAKVIRRPLAGRGGDVLAVVTRQQLSRGASVAVAGVGERALVVGVPAQQVPLLGEAPMAEFAKPATAPAERRPVDLPGWEPAAADANPVPVSPAP